MNTGNRSRNARRTRCFLALAFAISGCLVVDPPSALKSPSAEDHGGAAGSGANRPSTGGAASGAGGKVGATAGSGGRASGASGNAGDSAGAAGESTGATGGGSATAGEGGSAAGQNSGGMHAGGMHTGGTSSGGTSSSGTGGSAGSTAGATSGGTAGAGGAVTVDPYLGPFKILILSTIGAQGFTHDSIPDCQYMLGLESAKAQVANPLTPLGQTPDAMMPANTKPGSQFTVDLATDDLTQFTTQGLKDYAMVFSCNPAGTVFSGNANGAVAMAALQNYVEGGGAWGGVHSAADFEKTNGFPWFTNKLVGAYFEMHGSDGTSGTVQVAAEGASHPVMTGLLTTYDTQDEWYVMNRDPGAQPGFQILARLATDNRPVVWVKELGTKGRSFYTIRGHNKTVFKEAQFRQLVLNGILWATHRFKE